MIRKFIINLIICLALASSTVFASNNSIVTAEFFASNNTGKIDTSTAYNRLVGNEQKDLHNAMIEVLQRNHIEQGKFEDMLGEYTMLDNQQVTADNTALFTVSPYQDLSDKQILMLAQEMAIALKQESVAVFMPYTSSTALISVTFTSQHPTINEITNLLRNKLPTEYNQAYSIRLENKRSDFNHAKVAEIEWLGSKLNPNEIKKAFPQEEINFKTGKTFLVFQNGTKVDL